MYFMPLDGTLKMVNTAHFLFYVYMCFMIITTTMENWGPGNVIKDQETKRIHEMMTRSHARLNDNSLARKQQKQLHQKDYEPDQCALVGGL